MENVHRDTYASTAGHPALLEYLAIGNDTPKALMKTKLIEKMVKPCGLAPKDS